MATPSGITLNNNYSIILEIDGTFINTVKTTRMGGGYVRQAGALVDNCDIGDFVQYDTSNEYLFQQGSDTFSYINSSAILFVQSALP